jgi:hypothetical protein
MTLLVRSYVFQAKQACECHNLKVTDLKRGYACTFQRVKMPYFDECGYKWSSTCPYIRLDVCRIPDWPYVVTSPGLVYNIDDIETSASLLPNKAETSLHIVIIQRRVVLRLIERLMYWAFHGNKTTF